MICSTIFFVRSTYDLLCKQGETIYSFLLSLFRQTTPPLSLAHRTIRWGGVENKSNSCIFSVLLQELATLPAVYDPFLNTLLQKGPNEPEERWIARQSVQQSLMDCVRNIRHGMQVEQIQIETLAHHLQYLGWEGHISSIWRTLLHRFAPHLFPLPCLSVFQLYKKILNSITNPPSQTPLPIILAGKPNPGSLFDFFSSQPIHSPSLWRIALNHSPTDLEERIEVGPWEFSLRVVHAYQLFASGKHVVAYRKWERDWICCNDRQISQSSPSAAEKIYMLVYECRLNERI